MLFQNPNEFLKNSTVDAHLAYLTFKNRVEKSFKLAEILPKMWCEVPAVMHCNGNFEKSGQSNFLAQKDMLTKNTIFSHFLLKNAWRLKKGRQDFYWGKGQI